MSDLIRQFPLHFCKVRVDFCLIIIVGILISTGAHAHPDITGRVTSVIDGNTIEISDQDKQKIKVLLIGIDSPELGQEYGHEAKTFLEKIILKKNVIVQFQGKDHLGNQLAIVMINSKVDVRIELLKEGLAWTSEKDPSEDLEPYKTWAQRKERGLWKQENPVPPWTYRRQQTMSKPKGR